MVPFDLIWRTDFGFSSIIRWPGAIQRFLFSCLAFIIEALLSIAPLRLLMTRIVHALYVAASFLTPQIFVDLKRGPERGRLLLVIAATATATVIFSYLGNLTFCIRASTFSGTDPQRFYFVQDVHNRIIYLLIAPAYMAASAAVIYTSMSTMELMQPVQTEASAWRKLARMLRLAVTISGAVIVAALIQVNYFNDSIAGAGSTPNLKTICLDRVFWFAEQVGDTRYLNSAGVYYICVQFFRMATIAAAVWCVITSMIGLMKLGLSITPGFVASNGGGMTL